MNRYQPDAREDFERAYHRAVLGNLLARLCRRTNRLRSYHAACRQLLVTGERYRGARTVPVDKVIGSTDRCRDFDKAFRPLRAHAVGRWVSVARAYGEGRSLPPVQLYQIADDYFVRDGHHRVSVARVRGQSWIEAEVVEVLTLGPLPAPQVTEPPPSRAVHGTVTGWSPLQLGRLRRGASTPGLS